MMVINPPGDKELTVFTDTIKEALCAGTTYRFSANFLNVSIPSNCSLTGSPLPKFNLIVETANGVPITYVATGQIPYSYDLVFTPKFSDYSVDFVMPPGVNQLVLKILSLDFGIIPCEFRIAVDDIQFAAVGPRANIKFAGAIGLQTVEQVCFSENKIISMKGSVPAFYPDTRYQWQESTDSGFTWKDIPGATDTSFTKNFPVADTFLYRLSAGDASNISNINCRVLSNVLKVEVNGVPNNLVVSSNSPVCVGIDVWFDAETPGVIAYEWHGPNNFFDDVFYPSVNHTQLKDSGMYYVTITTVGGCKFTDSTYVKVYGIGAVTAGNDTAICLGNSVQLHGSKGMKIRWSPGNSLSDTTIADPIATPRVTTVYTIRVEDNSACISTNTVKVSVLNSVEVKAAFSATDFLCRPRDTATFINTSEGIINDWNWNFGNGQVGTEKDPQVVNYFIANDISSYTVLLAVKDTAGCTDTAAHAIKVSDNCYIAVPTAFTPNGDGKNDFLYPVNAVTIKDLLFRVYNRNGQVVFQTRTPDHKWDGRINGMLQPTGVFVWTLEYTDRSHKKIYLQGTSTLIR